MSDAMFSPASSTASLDSRSELVDSGARDRAHLTQRRLALFALVLAGVTLGLMALGSATRVMNAGLSCPDWPLCYGGLLPQQQMNLQVFLEWFHRLVAGTMGAATIVLAGASFYYRRQLPQWTPWAMGFALGLVVLQGALGGLTVTELLRFDIVTAHLGTGLAFFSTLLAIGLMLQNDLNQQRQNDLNQRQGGAQPDLAIDGNRLQWFGLAAVIAVYGQSLLGGLVASQWAVHQCFSQTHLCTVLNSHLLGVIPATGTTLLLLGYALRLYRQGRLDATVTRWAIAVASLLGAQLLIGLTTFRLRLQVELLTISHQLVGAALLGALVGLTVTAFWRSSQRQLWRSRVMVDQSQG
jgi:heme a synthase